MAVPLNLLIGRHLIEIRLLMLYLKIVENAHFGSQNLSHVFFFGAIARTSNEYIFFQQ